MEILILPLVIMGNVFIIAPYLALLPSAFFYYLYFKSKKRRLILITVILWFLYSIYESGMMLRILCTGECNIRIDLLLIYPLLILISVSAIINYIKWKKNENRSN